MERACSTVASYFGFRDLLWILRGRCFIFGALFPSKSGLIHTHIVKYIVYIVVPDRPPVCCSCGESFKTRVSEVSPQHSEQVPLKGRAPACSIGRLPVMQHIVDHTKKMRTQAKDSSDLSFAQITANTDSLQFGCVRDRASPCLRAREMYGSNPLDCGAHQKSAR